MIGSCTCTDGEYRLSFFAYKTQFSGNFMCICQSKWSDHRRASDVSNCFGWWFSYSSNSIKIITKSGNEKNKNVQKWKIRNSNKKNKLKFYFDRSHFFIRKQQIVKYVYFFLSYAASKTEQIRNAMTKFRLRRIQVELATLKCMRIEAVNDLLKVLPQLFVWQLSNSKYDIKKENTPKYSQRFRWANVVQTAIYLM